MITKLGRRKGTSVKLWRTILVALVIIGSIFLRSNEVKPKKYSNIRSKGKTSTYSGLVRELLYPGQNRKKHSIVPVTALETLFLRYAIGFDLRSIFLAPEDQQS